jgi:hypothetical protein
MLRAEDSTRLLFASTAGGQHFTQDANIAGRERDSLKT